MKVRCVVLLLLAPWVGRAASPAAPVAASSQSSTIEQRFDAFIQPRELRAWMQRLAAAPNHVGSAHDKANAEWILEQFKAWGWNAHIETFSVLYPTPLHESLTLLGPDPYRATLMEPPISGDASSSRSQDALPAYVTYQGDGDVTAPLVYVNYGMPDDYEKLERLGVSVKGKVVIARYGAGWRGLKPKLALEHGAVGCIIYSDPKDDGYSVGDVYPKGALRPPRGIQRGSVGDMTLYPGDVLTPGIGAIDGAPRLERSKARTIIGIPTLPISYADAQRLLEPLTGRVAPSEWRGSLPITYHLGGANVRVHLVVKSDWSAKQIFNVVAVLQGSQFPGQWVLRGNHHDGWVFGASDPLSGQVALLAEAKALGALAAQGWRPKRTIVYLSWDGEEPNLMGSTEWVETHAEELRRKAIIYINTDTNARGLLHVSGSHSYQRLVDTIASDLIDPETNRSVAERRRAGMLVAGQSADATNTQKAIARVAADASHSLPIAPMGSGSDYSPFIQHLGIAALDFAYGGEGDPKGVYHSAYDTWEHHTRFVDPGCVYDALLARTAGRVVLRMADMDVPAQRFTDFAEAVAVYVNEVKALADGRRDAATARASLLAGDTFQLSDDPTIAGAMPRPLAPVPFLNFAPLENAAGHLRESARLLDSALTAHSSAPNSQLMAEVFQKLQDIEQLLTADAGLPERPWYRNLIYAPGRFTGYGAKTLPGVREAVEEDRWADVETYVRLTAAALNAYATRLDEVFALFPPTGA